MQAQPLVEAILQEIIVAGAEAPIEGADGSAVIFAMNNYMFEIAADGVNLGFTEVTSGTSEITVERGAINGIVKNVALQVLNQFGSEVPARLDDQASKSYDVMVKLAVDIPGTSFPDTLPVGVANENSTGVHFYGEDPDVLLTESGLVIAPEANTELP